MKNLIIDEIKEDLPKNAEISDVIYEGSEIILYTENKDFFRTCTPEIKKIVNKVKKRIEVRSDPSLVANEEDVIEFIRQTVSKEAGIKDIYFEPEFAKVVIHAEKPGIVIGKAGETLNLIKEKTFWTPDIKRAPVIDSEIIRAIRKMLHNEAGYRKKFLHKLGEKIYSESKEIEWIRLTALGGFREVGRSCILLQTPQSRVLMDCGFATGSNSSKPFPYLDVSEFNIQSLDAIILSHAHSDHSGLVPYLYEFGFRGPLYCTRPTRDLAALLQLDYIQICHRENKKNFYTSKGIEEMIKHCITLDFGEVTDIAPDMRLTLQNAGHLLGSSVVHIHVGDGLYNILYTGDLKFEHTRMFEPTSSDFTRVEAAIIESTYGNEESQHPPRRESERYFVENIRRCIERGGRAIIPTFAVGRGQDVITILADSDLDIQIYLDGMVWDATAIHTAYPEFMSKNMQTKILHKSKNPFIDPRLKGIGSGKERAKIFESNDPCIILTTSGMLQGGPIMEYLRQLSSEPKNMLIFVGYQAEGTPGRRIQKGWKQIQFDDGTVIDLNLEIVTIEGLSGHSDYRQLINYISSMPNKPKKIMVNHGDPARCVSLARAVHKTFRVETIAPKNLETIRLV
ncbi:MAG: beta-CASP ribonuclease aCPSF1 [Candidatus Aenigmarchaeota archaeon]|nr:beta-CASP ribonuclease aCPSF1 [Candidatus Aenigmarchaeota archaeon]MDI6722503.1 beta-CASP ribonuclease aCPSF1 [Candidatus Aenigmarchaeota archaeon]